MRYLCFSTLLPVEIVGCPDSGKIGTRAMPPGSTIADAPWIRHLFTTGAAVDYYEGEKID